MTVIASCEELRRLLVDFSFEDIGFIRPGEDEHYIAYHKNPDLCLRVNPTNFEAQVFRCSEDGQPISKIGTFNIRWPAEVLFLLTMA